MAGETWPRKPEKFGLPDLISSQFTLDRISINAYTIYV
jgi:hypothetical protein